MMTRDIRDLYGKMKKSHYVRMVRFDESATMYCPFCGSENMENIPDYEKVAEGALYYTYGIPQLVPEILYEYRCNDCGLKC